MRVCHIIHALTAGGAEQVLVELHGAAPLGGFDMSVVALTGDLSSIHAQGLQRAGADVHALGLTSRWDLRAFPRALALAQAWSADIIHTHLKHADIVGAYVAQRMRIPHVSTLHVIEDSVSGQLAAKSWLAGQVRQRLTDRTIAVSEAQRTWYLSTFGVPPESVVTIHNGIETPPQVDEPTRSEVRRSLGYDSAAVIAAMVAIMRPGKGFDDLLAAIGLLPEDSPLRVVLIGDGPDRGALEADVAADPRLRERVSFIGYREDVPRLLASVDFVVHPSHADALPTALLHAISGGVPVVATDVGGIPEIVGPDAALLVPPRRPDLLVKAMTRLVEDGETRSRLGAAGRSRFEREFSAQSWAQRLADLYDELVTSSGNPGRRVAK